MPTVTITDQTTGGKTTGELTLDILTEKITVRELIRSRVYQEVQDFNRKQASGGGRDFQGLVQPTEAEVTLNGYKLKKAREIDWKKQYEKACAAFEGNGFLILGDEKQVEDLEEEVTLTARSTVTFLKLVPLVGG